MRCLDEVYDSKGMRIERIFWNWPLGQFFFCFIGRSVIRRTRIDEEPKVLHEVSKTFFCPMAMVPESAVDFRRLT